MRAKDDVLRDPARLFAQPQVSVTERGDGVLYLKSPLPLQPCPRSVGADLVLQRAAASTC